MSLAPEIAPLDAWLPGFDAARADELLCGFSPLDWLDSGGVVENLRAVSGRFVAAASPEAERPILELVIGLSTEGQLVCHCPCRSPQARGPVPAPAARRAPAERAPEAGPAGENEDAARALSVELLTGQLCVHQAALVRALVGDADLRRSLAGLAPLAGAPAILDAARAEGVDRAAAGSEHSAGGLLDLTISGWRRRGRVEPLGRVMFAVEVDPGDPADPDLPAGLRVQVLEAGTRRLLQAELIEGRRISGAEWRLLEPLLRDRAGRGGFVARGERAALFLERARAAHSDMILASDQRALHWDQVAWRPALRVRTARATEIGEHSVVHEVRAASLQQRAQLERVAGRLERGGLDAPLGLVARTLGLPLEDIVHRLASQPFVLEAVWRRATRAAAEALQHSCASQETELPFSSAIVLLGGSRWIVAPAMGLVARIADDVGPIAVARLLGQPTVLFEQEQALGLQATLHEIFSGEGVLLPSREELGLPPKSRARIRLRLTGGLFEVAAQLEAAYGSEVHLLERGWEADPHDDGRDADGEEAALLALDEAGLASAIRMRAARGRGRGRPAAARQDVPPPRQAVGDAAVEFWTRTLPGLVAASEKGGAIHEILVPKDLAQLRVREDVRSRLRAGVNGTGLLDLAFSFDSEGLEVEMAALRRALAERRQWVVLADGSVARLSERVAEAATLAVSEEALQGVRAVSALGALGHLTGVVDRVEIDAQLSSWLERIRRVGHRADAPALPRGLRAELRPYQREGVAWLQLLAELGVGGVLADDMGLGKTLQMLTAIAWRREREGAAPSLIVTPTSVVSVWLHEAARFLPELRVLLLHGADRHDHYDQVDGHDVVVTTYALLRRDVERLRNFRFRYVVLDEAQNVKNHAALTTVAARSLQAGSHVALTGTPIENRLLELWSLIDFAAPGLLGTSRSFARRFEAEALDSSVTGTAGATDASRPAEKGEPSPVESATVRRQRFEALRARIRPFILRRTKAQVERDLPPRIETDVVVEMTPHQRRAYAALAATLKQDIDLSRGDAERMVVLTALLRLRQMACDPRLLDPASKPEDSCKLLAFRELVNELRPSGRRALVFSQFVEVLSLLRRDLDARGIPYAYLDGATVEREAVVAGFVQGDAPLFLLSLRAGGSGLNLAAADTVIHMDPWWNPAVEDQATDRAHRIGQTRAVSVYRILAAGTIEEPMRRLVAAKRELARGVLGELGEGAALRGAELEELLRGALEWEPPQAPVV